MAQWPRATKIARQKVPKRDAAKHLTHRIHQTLLKTKAKRAVPLFVALQLLAIVILVMQVLTLQLPLRDHCSQLHCSAPRAHTAMQHSCYKFKMQCYEFRMLDLRRCPLLWVSAAASS